LYRRGAAMPRCVSVREQLLDDSRDLSHRDLIRRSSRPCEAQGTSSRLALLRCRVVSPRKPSLEPSRSPHRRRARVERFPADGFLPDGIASLPTPCGPSRQLSVYIAHGRTCVEQAYGLLSWWTTTMLGGKVTATATYCGHTLQAETDVDDLGRWTGRCVVGGPQFQGTVVLYSPFRAPTAALDALLTAARRSIDEGRNVAWQSGTRRRRLA
jgi:hypothetical protein